MVFEVAKMRTWYASHSGIPSAPCWLICLPDEILSFFAFDAALA